jgi:hypothetical protein
MSHAILKNQNNPELIDRLKASTVAYTRAKKWETFFSYFYLLLAIAYPISYAVIKEESIKIALFGCSFFLTITIQILALSLSKNTSKGAIFKEEFDTILFKLPWKSTIQKAEKEEVTRMAFKYKGREIRDWYSTTLSEYISHNTAVGIIQYTNTLWDINLRKLYRRWIIYFLISYSILVSAFVLLMGSGGLAIFFIAFSVLSFYNHFFTLLRGHSSIIKKRECISAALNQKITAKKYFDKSELRDFQDEIYSTRQESAKVPNFFFRVYYNKLNKETEEYISRVNEMYKPDQDD